MSDTPASDCDVVYDRTLLLGEAKRNAVLELWEVERYGRDSFGNADYVSLYGLRPADWHAQDVRLLGRTAVECTRDELAAAIARDVSAVADRAPRCSGTLVIDPFAGSGNTLHWICRALPFARGLGFELDEGVFALTRRNAAALNLSVIDESLLPQCTRSESRRDARHDPLDAVTMPVGGRTAFIGHVTVCGFRFLAPALTRAGRKRNRKFSDASDSGHAGKGAMSDCWNGTSLAPERAYVLRRVVAPPDTTARARHCPGVLSVAKATQHHRVRNRRTGQFASAGENQGSRTVDAVRRHREGSARC
jgi:hypothetical protein